MITDSSQGIVGWGGSSGIGRPDETSYWSWCCFVTSVELDWSDEQVPPAALSKCIQPTDVFHTILKVSIPHCTTCIQRCPGFERSYRFKSPLLVRILQRYDKVTTTTPNSGIMEGIPSAMGVEFSIMHLFTAQYLLFKAKILHRHSCSFAKPPKKRSVVKIRVITSTDTHDSTIVLFHSGLPLPQRGGDQNQPMIGKRFSNSDI